MTSHLQNLENHFHIWRICPILCEDTIQKTTPLDFMALKRLIQRLQDQKKIFFLIQQSLVLDHPRTITLILLKNGTFSPFWRTPSTSILLIDLGTPFLLQVSTIKYNQIVPSKETFTKTQKQEVTNFLQIRIDIWTWSLLLQTYILTLSTDRKNLLEPWPDPTRILGPAWKATQTQLGLKLTLLT